MDFADASAFFSHDPVYDAYTGEVLFYGHTAAHDDHTSSGATARRRTLTAALETEAPTRRAVMLYDEAWLVGSSNPDSFFGSLVRRNYDLKKSTGLMTALTPGEACNILDVGAGTLFHAHRAYFRDTQDARTDADWDTMWSIFHAPIEPVRKGMFLRQGSTLYRVRNKYDTVELLDVAEADQLDDDALQPVAFFSTERDLVTEAPIGFTVNTTAVQTDVMKFYEFRVQAESKVQPGDRVVFVAASAVQPKVGAQFRMQGATWRVLAAVPELDALALHARRV